MKQYRLNSQQLHNEIVDIVNYLDDLHFVIQTKYHGDVNVTVKPIYNQGTFYLEFDKPVHGFSKAGLSLEHDLDSQHPDLNKIHKDVKSYIRGNILSLISSKLDFRENFVLVPRNELSINSLLQ